MVKNFTPKKRRTTRINQALGSLHKQLLVLEKNLNMAVKSPLELLLHHEMVKNTDISKKAKKFLLFSFYTFLYLYFVNSSLYK